MKEYYPLHYARFRSISTRGRWHISGASWNTNDPNMPSAKCSSWHPARTGALQARVRRAFDRHHHTDCFGFGYTAFAGGRCDWMVSRPEAGSAKPADFFRAPYHKKNPSRGAYGTVSFGQYSAAFDTGGYTARTAGRRGV